MLARASLERAVVLVTLVITSLFLGGACTPSSSSPGPRPIISEVRPGTGHRGEIVDFTVTASGAPTSYDWVFSAPGAFAWAGVEQRHELVNHVSVQLASSGLFTGVVTATNAAGTSDPFAFTITVDDVACFGFGLIETTLAAARVGQAYDARVHLAGPALEATDTPLFRVTRGALPPGVTLSESDGHLTGTPTRAGQARFTLQATARTCSAEQAYVIDVTSSADCTGFHFQQPAVVRTVVQYAPFDQSLASEVTGPISHLELLDGALPLGLRTVDPDRIAGTPEANGDTTGTLQVVRGDGLCADRARIDIHVAPPSAGDAGTDATVDAAADATIEAGDDAAAVDAGTDATVDAGADAAVDAGPTTLMTMSGTGVGLVLAGGTVYATAKGEDSLWAVTTAGANPHKVAVYAAEPAGPPAFLTDTVYTVVMTAAGGGSVAKAPNTGTGGAATTFVGSLLYPPTPTANVYGVATDGTSVFFSEDADPALHKTSVAGTDSTYASASAVQSVATDGTYVYYTTYGVVDHRIQRTDVALSLAPKTILSTSDVDTMIGRPTAMTIYGGVVYVVGAAGVVVGIAPGMTEVDTATVPYISASMASKLSGGRPTSIAVDATGVYVGVAAGTTSGNGVYRFALTGASPPATLIAPTTLGAAAVALDGTSLYYATGTTVMRTPKP